MGKQIPFTKMQALGNNYIYINLFKEILDEEALSSLARAVSDVHTGIGSDGMILICPSDVAQLKMRIFNKDGSEGKNCGNGLRCVAKYAYMNNLVQETSFSIETLSGIVQVQIEKEEIIVDMGYPLFKRESIPMIGTSTDEVAKEYVAFEGKEYLCTSLSMGNSHTVFIVDNIEEAPLTTLGPIMERHPWFPESVNTEFIEIINEKEMHFRVWERGSGVTQACGTGACAAVVAATIHQKVTRGEEITVHLAGGDLFITWTEQGRVFMRGPAMVVCDGTYYDE